ncbi:class I SAM-dependent methyltransferase [Streptomyces sp. A3M-1-3]|uniref:class I SAM-dependent methyltransferase n=1 Tax=Streptomyces sp. A3M-1-3 TaxID=2962044 RepID=UPI0020B6F0DF|nr:class I SAM-dependent methyltransferase [Streptomyces sp. A3M-1-3]MCP3819624.1 class I SAM-dependent methyltransferase [Streptomyces sp. A3M-1-3]
MTSPDNSAQAEAWNGYEGRHWAERQRRYDALNDAANEPLLEAARITGTDRVLDIGCGNGRITRLAARAGAYALGVDLSAPMLERARVSAQAERLDNVGFAQGDAQVYAFDSGAFDVAVSRFGVMFFADPVAAFANIGRALRPGGRLAFICPQDFSGSEQATVFAAVARHVQLPQPSADAGPGSLSLADPEHTARVLTDAGFREVVVSGVELPHEWGKDAEDATGFLFGWGPMQHWLRDADPAAEARAREAAVEAFRTYETASGVRLTAAHWVVTALRPTP